MIKVLFICHGNICRSTMCESVFTYLAEQNGLKDRFLIDSFATSYEEIGNPPHCGTREKLKEKGIPLVPHRAKRIEKKDYLTADYIIGMDDENIRNLLRIFGGDPYKKIYKLLQFAGLKRDVEDPWYTGDFEKTYEDVYLGSSELMKFFLEKDHYKK